MVRLSAAALALAVLLGSAASVLGQTTPERYHGEAQAIATANAVSTVVRAYWTAHGVILTERGGSMPRADLGRLPHDWPTPARWWEME